MNLLQLLLSCSYDFLMMMLCLTLDIFMVTVGCFVVYQAFGLILTIMQFQTFIDIVIHFQYPPILFIESHIFPICLTCAVHWCITRTLIRQIYAERKQDKFYLILNWGKKLLNVWGILHTVDGLCIFWIRDQLNSYDNSRDVSTYNRIRHKSLACQQFFHPCFCY